MINDTMLTWLGYERAEMIGRSLREFLRPERRDAFTEKFQQLKESGQLKGITAELIRGTVPACSSSSMLR